MYGCQYKTWGVAFGKFYGVTYSILIVNGNLLTHLKHADGMSLRYGVYVMVLLGLLGLLNLLNFV